MKANDTVSILESLVSKESIDRTIRDNFLPVILIFLLLLYAHWNDYLPDSNRSAYIIISFLALLKSSIIFNKYRNPFHYSPSYMLYVRDRNDSMVIMKPYIDPLMIKLGLIKPEEFVDVRYSMYPDLDLGVDFDTDTGYISGYPMESGNHVSQVKMTFLGGSYSTTARIEVANTLKVRASKSNDDFAPPRTVAQLLLREEDLKIREDKIDEEFEKRRLELEDEYLSKQRSLEDQLNLERQEWSDTLEDTKEEFEQRLQIKEEEIDKIKLDTSVTLQQKEKEFVELQDEMKEKVSSSKERIEELEMIAVETGAAAADLEHEIIDMFDTLSTGFDDNTTKSQVSKPAEEIEKEVRLLKPRFEEAVQNDDQNTITELRPKLEELMNKRDKLINETIEEDKVDEQVEEDKPDEQAEEDKPDEQVEEDKPDEQVEEDKPDTTIKAEELDETDYESMSVSQIKKMLREKGLSRSGRKAVLIARLRD